MRRALLPLVNIASLPWSGALSYQTSKQALHAAHITYRPVCSALPGAPWQQTLRCIRIHGSLHMTVWAVASLIPVGVGRQRFMVFMCLKLKLIRTMRFGNSVGQQHRGRKDVGAPQCTAARGTIDLPGGGSYLPGPQRWLRPSGCAAALRPSSLLR